MLQGTGRKTSGTQEHIVIITVLPPPSVDGLLDLAGGGDYRGELHHLQLADRDLREVVVGEERGRGVQVREVGLRLGDVFGREDWQGGSVLKLKEQLNLRGIDFSSEKMD